jgi:hypothetical protein
MPTFVTPQQRSQSASASRSLRTARNSRVSCCRRPRRALPGTRTVTMTAAFPMSIPAARSANSGSSSTSSTVALNDEGADTVVAVRGSCGQAKSGPRARSINSRPSKQLPAIRLSPGVRPARRFRRQRTATPDLRSNRAPGRRCPPRTAPRHARGSKPQPATTASPRHFHALRRPPATDDCRIKRCIRHVCGKLGAHGRTEAVTQARARGLLARSPRAP